MAEEQLLYRYRTLKHIFEYKELENQEIYLSPIQQVNDPMEGYRNIIFKGDKIVWKNLFKHYLMCLFEIIILNDISRKELNNSFTIKDVHYLSIGSFYGNVYLQSLCICLYDKFFSIFDEEIEQISKQKHNITLDELSIYIYDIHCFTIELIYCITRHNNEDTIENNKIITKNNLNKSIEYCKNNYQNKEKIVLFKLNKTSFKKIGEKNKFIEEQFIHEYIKILKKLVIPNELIACFSDNAKNFLMWSHYADSHKGICLIFNTYIQNELPTINLRLNNSNKYTINSFYPVRYGLYNKTVNFFKNIHSTTQSVYRNFWYIDFFNKNKSNKSKYYHEDVYDIYDDKSIKEYNLNNKYLTRYLKNMQSILFKLKDWKDEREYRLVSHDFANNITSNNGEIYKYNFNSLNGIIFGTNTPFEEKISIINIIKNKCIKENRKNFNFYEMQIDETSGKLIQIPLKIDLSIQEPLTEHNNE